MSDPGTDSLREWLRAEIRAILTHKVSPPPLLLWCDPGAAWRDLLRAAAEGGAFELWSDDVHELALRERLVDASPAPRVVWLPRSADELTYLKVFELQAESVWTETLVSALARYGVEIPRDHEMDLRTMLPAHAKEWIDRPRASWRNLTPGAAKSTLVDDEHILAALARSDVSLTELIGADRIAVFARRVTEDFGLPAPEPGKDDAWRVAATACLLATEAAVRVPAEPPGEGARIIPPGPARDEALKLLARWQRDVERMAAFELLGPRADATTSLVHWARNLAIVVPPLASQAVEQALVQKEIEHLARLEQFEPLARRLEEREPFYVAHDDGFWGSRAEKKVPWSSLVALARAAAALSAGASVSSEWKTPGDAVLWFTREGWKIDHQGEVLFQEDAELPGGLHPVRARLRRAYQRHLDACNVAFSDLLHHQGVDTLGLEFAGAVLARERPPKEPMAVVVLDACRYDLGARLAEMLDKGEPARRARVLPARAPLPTITALGMPFALADDPLGLTVELSQDSPVRWRVTAPGESQDLVVAEARREWLRRRFKLKAAAVTDTKSVLDSVPPTPREAGRLLFVFGDEFDKQGHEGELDFTGAGYLLERYVRLIRRLRDAGYSCVALVTDHGYFHWEPDKDEVEPPPTGDVLWASRRAVAGRDLRQAKAIVVPVQGSDLECRVPRSVNAFRAYGKLGFFHGGASLQELVIPVVVFKWPKKAEKASAVLTPLSVITSLRPRVEVKPGASGHLPGVGAPSNMTGRQVLVKVVERGGGRTLFRSQASVKVDPDGAPVTLDLQRIAGENCAWGSQLMVELRDADNDELLDHCKVELKVAMEEWD